MKLVYKQEAIKLLRGKCVAKYPNTFMMGLFAAADEIEKLPEVEAVPVVHGRWLSEMHGNSLNGTCSVCGSYDHAYAFDWKYCPECGAKMDLPRQTGRD